jgi:hypothetical protein
MAQISTVIQADPWSLATALAALPGNVSIAEKSTSAGKFIVVYDDGADDQSYTVLVGDPDKVSAAINVMIAGGATIDIVVPTFSAAHYIVVHT